MKKTAWMLLCAGLSSTALGHNCPYEWNRVELPDRTYSNLSVAELAHRVNAAVAEASTNRVPRAIIIKKTRTSIVNLTKEPELGAEFEALAARYRAYAKEMLAEGGKGFETTIVHREHLNKSIACNLICVAMNSEMGYEETPEGAVFSRAPALLECRAYRLSDALAARAKKNEMDLTKAFVIHSELHRLHCPRSASRPINENQWEKKAESSMVTYLPERKCFLVLAPAFSHREMKNKLKQKGFWKD